MPCFGSAGNSNNVGRNPVFEYFFFPCCEKYFLEVGWRWREEEIASCLAQWFKFYVSYQMLHTKCYGVGAPPWTDRGSHRAYLQHFISSFYESIVNKREKLEFGCEQGWVAAAEGLLPFCIKSACLRLGLDVTWASLCHSKGRFYLSLRNWSNWSTEYLTQFFEFTCSLPTNIACCLTSWCAVQMSPCIYDELDTRAKESSCAISPLSAYVSDSLQSYWLQKVLQPLLPPRHLSCEDLWRPFCLSFFPLFGSSQTLASSVSCISKSRVYRYFDLFFSAVGSVPFPCCVSFLEWLNLVLIPLTSHTR